MTRGLLLVAAAVTAAACSTPATPTSSTPTPVSVITTVFSGTLAVGSTRFYSFQLTDSGTVQLMLASVNPTPTTSSTAALLVGFGVPHGTGCDATRSALMAPSLVPQMTFTALAGTYCVSVSDVGNLSRDSAFAIRFLHS